MVRSTFGGAAPMSDDPRGRVASLAFLVRIRALVGACFAVLVICSACGGDPEAPSHPIGAVGARSMLWAVEMALDDGGVPVQAERRDELLLLEHTPVVSPASDLAERMVRNPGILGVVGHSGSSGSIIASAIYNRREVVQIAPTSTAPVYSRAGPFSFRLVPPDDVQGAFLAEVVNQRFSQPRGRAAVLYVNDDYGRALREAFVRELDPDRVEVVLQLPHLERETSPFRPESQVEAIQASRPDLLIWLGRPPELDLLLPLLREVMGDLAVLGGDALSRAETRSELHPAWEGVQFADFRVDDPDGRVEAFLHRYEARTGIRGGIPEALAYDAASILLHAVQAGARNGDGVRRHLLRFGQDLPPFPGLTGPIQFTPSGDVERSYELRMVRMPGEGR